MLKTCLIARSLVIAILLACGDAQPSSSNDVILRDYSCPSCRIVAESVALIGHEDDTVMVTQTTTPAVDSKGQFYLPSTKADQIQVFNSSGRLIHTFGNPGQGPGEFHELTTVLTMAADSLLVFNSHDIVSVVAPNFSVVRQFRLLNTDGSPYGARVLPDGSILLTVIPHSFRRFKTNGDTLGLVKLAGADTSRKCMECVRRKFFEAPAGGAVWSLTSDSYRVERHALDGTLQLRFTRETDWFKPWDPEPAKDEMMDPTAMLRRPMLIAVDEGAGGLLWTYTLFVADTASIPRSLDFDNPRAMAAFHARFSSRVDVIDIASRTLLAGTTFKELAMPFGADLAGLYSADSSGDLRWKVVRLKVTGR